MTIRLTILHVLSPLHCGTGQSVGGIDLPIAREKASGVPIVPGSSLKGVLRSVSAPNKTAAEDARHRAAFGPETMNASDHAGGLAFSDLLLAFLPVRSVRGTYAMVTSPYLLRRVMRDAQDAGIALPALPGEPSAGKALHVHARIVAKIGDRSCVVLDDFDLNATQDPKLTAWVTRFAELAFADANERTAFVERTCLVDEDTMAVLLETGTEVTARNHLNAETKTVDGGGLWTEESLPVESLLVGLVLANSVVLPSKERKEADELMSHVHQLTAARAIQVGGKASVGRGLCRVRVLEK